MPPKRKDAPPASTTPSSSKRGKGKNEGPEIFHVAVKQKLDSSHRTGQACDRCKVRKIKCDGVLSGCSPCLQNNTDCITTDRITGQARSRGYTEELEAQNEAMANKLQEYEARLTSMGITDFESPISYEIRSSNADLVLNGTQQNDNAQLGQGVPSNARSRNNTMGYSSHSPPTRDVEANIFKALPVFRTGLTGDNYCGVASGSSDLSSIRGTALSVLGMEIDLADFACPDMDNPGPNPSANPSNIYNKSYQSFLQTAFGANARLNPPRLPPKDEGLAYAVWYMRTVNPYVPLLHAPTFKSLMTRMYDDGTFTPAVAEVVMVHMVLAIIFFQLATRNPQNVAQTLELNQQSNLHYHYASQFIYQLMASHTVQDVQALALICVHLRNFPKPGASWMVINGTFSLAIELGLNRSAAAWRPNVEQKTVLQIEMRKRIFWTILLLLVQISSRLGRPMPLRKEDFDIEIPEAIDDDLITHDGVDTSRDGKCAFKIGIEAMKLQPLFIDLYSNVYGIKRSGSNYIESVRRLDHQLQVWRENWPIELNLASGVVAQEDWIFGKFLETWELEFKILLHHPSQSLTTSSEFNTANINICLEAADSLLRHAQGLQKYRSFDTTWYKAATYTMAIATTLFGYTERTYTTESVGTGSMGLAKLKADMNAWLHIMRDLGHVLGSGDRLHDAIKRITDTTLSELTGILAKKTASAAVATANLGRSRSRSPEDVNRHMQTPYPAVAQYAYPEPSISAYAGPPNSRGSGLGYPEPSSINAGGQADAAPQTSVPGGLYQSSESTSVYPRDEVIAGSQNWRQWTEAMAGQLEPNLDLNSASALMQLGGRSIGGQGPGQGGASIADMTGGMAGGTLGVDPDVNGENEQTHPWPLSIFNIGQGGP